MRVVAAAVLHQERILIARRNGGKLKGLWEFPGGKVERGESDQAALTRELHEELGLDVRLGECVGEFEFKDPEIHLTLVLYWAFSEAKERKMTDHDQVEWLKPEEIDPASLAPADISAAKSLKRWVETHGLPKA